MEHHFVRNLIRHSKRHSNMNELFLSPSFYQIHHRKQPRLFKQEVFNQNSQRLPTKSIYSSSYTSLNSYLKEFNLSEKDFFELQQALKTIFHYLKPKIICDDKQLFKQRLTSPYLQQQQLINDDQSSLPLYTNEYFIRNGLLNHNDGPEIYDNIFQSRNLCYSHHFKSCLPSSSSSVNISLPLALLSNQKYLFNALTSNFASEKSRRTCSNMELNMFKRHEKGDSEENETKSMMIRRNKVKTWKRENILQQKMSITYSLIQQNDHMEASQYHRSSIVRTSSIRKDEKIVKINEESIEENSTSLRMCNKKDGNDKLLEIRNTDGLFPMMKILAPYIIIRDSFHVNSTNNHSTCMLSRNIDSTNNEESIEHVNHLTSASEKGSLSDVLHPTLIIAKRQSPLLSSSSTMNQARQINNEEPVYQRKKNYLLAEFESVLTQISKK